MAGEIELEVEHLTTPRPGLRITARDAEGRAGVGEGFPLPERSEEDLEAAGDWVTDFELEGDPLVHARRAQGSLGPDYPVTTFALESALLELASLQTGHPLWALLRGEVDEDDEPPPEPEVNALLPTQLDGAELVAAASAALAEGFTTLKLKLGRLPFDEELAHLRTLREAIGPGVRLRADANGAWSLAEATEHLEALEPLSLEFVEQPVPAADLPTLAPAPVPVAADESLSDPDLVEQLLANHRAAIWVLKPGALGIRRTLELAMLARSEDLELVITHAADGPVALEHARAVARALAPFRLACGLANPGQANPG